MTQKAETAVITGAGDGIGRALAVTLNARGVNLYLCDISPERLAETEQMLDTDKGSVTTTVVDCGNREAIEAWAESITREVTTIEFLFNNAGVAYASESQRNIDNFEWLMNISTGVWSGQRSFLAAAGGLA